MQAYQRRKCGCKSQCYQRNEEDDSRNLTACSKNIVQNTLLIGSLRSKEIADDFHYVTKVGLLNLICFMNGSFYVIYLQNTSYMYLDISMIYEKFGALSLMILVLAH